MNEPTIRVGKYSFTRTRWVEILHEAETGLRNNAHDREAREAIKAAGEALGQSPPDEAQLARVGGGESDPIGADIPPTIQGFGDAALDLARNIPQLIRPDAKGLGQMTGIANIPNALKVGQNPDADWSDKLDAMLRALPTNIGYAPMAQAVTDYDPQHGTENVSTREHARHIGNVASLALLGLGGTAKPAPEGFSRFGGPEVPPMGPRNVGPITPEVEPMASPRGPTPPAPVDANWSPVLSDLPPRPQLALPPVKPPVTDVPIDMGRVQGQKGVTFGEESPLAPTIQAQIKDLLGQISRNQPGPESIEPIQGATGFNTGNNYGRSAIGPETPPVSSQPTLLEMQQGISPKIKLQQARALMDKHTPESIQGTDMLQPGTGEFNLGKNNGPDVPMGNEGGFLGGKFGDAATIMFSPRLYLLLKRLNRTPEDLVGASRRNAAIGAVVQDLSTASVLGQPQRIKELEDQIARMMQSNGTPQR